MPADRIDLKTLKALCEKATPGPWFPIDRTTSGYGGPKGSPDTRTYAVEIRGDGCCRDGSPWREGLLRWSSRIVAVIQDWAQWTDHPANRDFICAARTALPALITEVEALRAELEDERDRSDGYQDLIEQIEAALGLEDQHSIGCGINPQEISALRADRERLDWLSTSDAMIAHSKDGDDCWLHWPYLDDADGKASCNGKPFSSARQAIDAARSAQ